MDVDGHQKSKQTSYGQHEDSELDQESERNEESETE
jgi:hypothetical protein